MQQHENKSKQIFQQVTEYYTEKERLKEEIGGYKKKIVEKEKELSEQGLKMFEIEKLVGDRQKENEK